jgi:hypothetical protein
MPSLVAVISAGIPSGYKALLPDATIAAAAKAELPLDVALAMLCKETGGGRNVFGHDAVETGGRYVKGETVTKEKYLAYKAWRDEALQKGLPSRMQGVGPAQLTWWKFQDQADELGGCWIPEHNIYIGCKSLRENLARGADLRDTFSIYNAGKPARDTAKGAAYADHAVALAAEWRAVIATASKEPAQPNPEPQPNKPIVLHKNHRRGRSDIRCSGG